MLGCGIPIIGDGGAVGGPVRTIAGWTLRGGFPARLSLEKAGGKNTRAPPWTRVFMAARSHSLVLGSLSLKRSRGYFLRDAKTDLGRIFEKKYAGKHFK